jgi:ABC-2 type transport system ATP-binding protein
VIEVAQLSKSFGSVRALDKVSFEVAEGSILGFLGPNGAGKTTTLRILTGFLPGDSGTARVAGLDVRARSLEVRRLLGYLPEGAPLYPEMRVMEYLRFRARLKGIPWRERKSAIAMALEQAGVAQVRRRILGTLSRGYRQRVSLADALLGSPKVLILDEPTVGLDPEQVRQFRQVVKDVGRERTVILSTHILSEVELICSQLVIIHKGRVVARGTTADLRTKLGSMERTVAEVAGTAAEIQSTLLKDPRVTHVSIEERKDFHVVRVESRSGDDLREAVYCAARDGGWTLRELRREVLSLEDVFVGVLGGSGRQDADNAASGSPRDHPAGGGDRP